MHIGKYVFFKKKQWIFALMMMAAIAGTTACNVAKDAETGKAGQGVFSQKEIVEKVIAGAGNPQKLEAEEGATVEITYWTGPIRAISSCVARI